jgi:hypothetical protein
MFAPPPAGRAKTQQRPIEQKARLAGGPRGRKEPYRFFFGFFCSFFIAVPLDIATSMTACTRARRV